MDDIKTIRRRNLKILKAEAGSLAEINRRLGRKDNYLQQLTGKKSRKHMGDEFARELEVVMGKLHGWMDKAHSESDDKLNSPVGEARFRWVREITWTDAGEGAWMNAAATESAMRPLVTSVSIGPRAFALRVRDDSMVDPHGSRSYPVGAFIIVDPDRSPRPGDRVIVKLPSAGESTFKQLEFDGVKQFMKPLNPRYPVVEMPPDARIVGVVVQTQIDE